MYRGSTPCQRTCAPHNIEPFRLISRTRDALCTLAPGSACWQHPPAGTSEQSCSVYHPASTADYTTLLVQSNSACRLDGNIPCQRTCAQHRIEPFCLGSQNLLALCKRAPGSACWQHPPAGISEQSCSAHHLRTELQCTPTCAAGHTTLHIQSKQASRRAADTPCQRTCAPHKNEPFRLESR